jgi:hypothetical protein
LADSPSTEVTGRVLVGGSADGTLDGTAGWWVAFVAGLGLTLVGWLNVAFVWYPPRWANVDWEFGSIRTTFEGLPLSTIGLMAMTASVVARGRRVPVRLMAALLLVLALVWTVFAVIFVLDVPVVFRAVRPEVRPALKQAVIQTGLMAATYVVLYLIIGVWAFRRARASAKGASR